MRNAIKVNVAESKRRGFVCNWLGQALLAVQFYNPDGTQAHGLWVWEANMPEALALHLPDGGSHVTSRIERGDPDFARCVTR